MKPALFLVISALVFPCAVFAVAPPPGALGGGKHPKCVAWVRSGATTPPPTCEVEVPNVGKGVGVCVQEECKGTGATGLGDGASGSLGDLGLGILGQVVQQVLGQLLQQALGGASGGSGGGVSGGGAYSSSGSDTIDTGVTDAINRALGDKELTEDEGNFTDLEGGSSAKTILDSVFQDRKAENESERVSEKKGDALGFGEGVTQGLVGGSSTQGSTSEPQATPETTQNNSSAGFYGSAVAVQDETILGRLCTNRPWANSFITSIIPASFFDSLCVSRGYVPGGEQSKTAAAAPVDTTRAEQTVVARAATVRERGMTCPEAVREGAAVSIAFSCAPEELDRAFGFNAGGLRSGTFSTILTKETQYGVQCADGYADSCRVQVVHPKLTIWAEPESVRLGARAVVYWSAEDVKEGTCVVRGPSFSETGGAGGASTVPINTRSVYTFSCTALDGAQLQETLTIDLAL